jgi:site-specific recombinase XerD
MDRDYFVSEDQDALFVTEKGNRLASVSISRLVEKYCEEGLGYKISPHKLRSGFCSILYNKTHDAEFVRRAVGHSNIATTQRYIKTNDNEKEIASNIIGGVLKL